MCFLCNTDEIAEEEIRNLNSLAAQGVDGIISLATNIDETTINDFMEEYGRIPLVMVNSTISHPRVSTLQTNNYRGSQLVVDYLLQKGHTAIGMLTNKVARNSGKSRPGISANIGSIWFSERSYCGCFTHHGRWI